MLAGKAPWWGREQGYSTLCPRDARIGFAHPGHCHHHHLLRAWGRWWNKPPSAPLSLASSGIQWHPVASLASKLIHCLPWAQSKQWWWLWQVVPAAVPWGQRITKLHYLPPPQGALPAVSGPTPAPLQGSDYGGRGGSCLSHGFPKASSWQGAMPWVKESCCGEWQWQQHCRRLWPPQSPDATMCRPPQLCLSHSRAPLLGRGSCPQTL